MGRAEDTILYCRDCKHYEDCIRQQQILMVDVDENSEACYNYAEKKDDN